MRGSIERSTARHRRDVAAVTCLGGAPPQVRVMVVTDPTSAARHPARRRPTAGVDREVGFRLRGPRSVGWGRLRRAERRCRSRAGARDPGGGSRALVLDSARLRLAPPSSIDLRRYAAPRVGDRRGLPRGLPRALPAGADLLARAAAAPPGGVRGRVARGARAGRAQLLSPQALAAGVEGARRAAVDSDPPRAARGDRHHMEASALRTCASSWTTASAYDHATVEPARIDRLRRSRRGCRALPHPEVRLAWACAGGAHVPRRRGGAGASR